MRYLILILVLISCGPQKRLNKLIDNNPELVQNDTIRDTISVIVPEIRTDTFISLDSLIDTVYVTKDRLQIKTVIRDNQLFIEGKCDADTIYKSIEIPVEKVVYLKDTPWTDVKKYVKRWWRWLLGLSIVALAVRLAKKFLPI